MLLLLLLLDGGLRLDDEYLDDECNDFDELFTRFGLVLRDDDEDEDEDEMDELGEVVDIVGDDDTVMTSVGVCLRVVNVALVSDRDDDT